jgi:hypothetical protein
VLAFSGGTLDAAASFVKEIHRISSPSARSHGWLPSLSKAHFTQSLPSSAHDVLGLA